MNVRAGFRALERAVWACVPLAAVVLAGCEQGALPEQMQPARPDSDEGHVYQQETGGIRPKAVVPASVGGTWSAVHDWPIIPVHIVLLPDGRMLSYGTRPSGQQGASADYDIWNPALGNGLDAHTTLSNQTGVDIFCSSQVIVPGEGIVAIAGGDVDNQDGTTQNNPNSNGTTYNYGSNALAKVNNLKRARWYSSSTVMLNGDVYIQGGSGGTDRPEVRQAGGTFRLLGSVDTHLYNFQYPRNFVAPDGQIFGYSSDGYFYYVDPSANSGQGAINALGQISAFSSYRTNDASTAMFRPGRILHAGGSAGGGIVIDISRTTTPTFTPTATPMSSHRHLQTAALLADGSVLITGGSDAWNELTNVNYTAERWDPRTNAWTVGNAGTQARLYHSESLLLPDATVFVGGGGAPGPQNNKNFEIYTPYYLYDANNNPAPRPTLAGVPAQAVVGRSFNVQFGNATGISRVTLVKHGSVTHDFNMEQRFVDLAFETSGNQVTAHMPARASDVPPGYYMLFVFDLKGVPSIAKSVLVPVAGSANAAAPTITVPGDQTYSSGSVSLPVSASDPQGNATLHYAATGLPPGLGINRTTGAITGTPQLTGRFYPVVAASDGTYTATANFLWTVNASSAPPLQINPVTPPPPALTGNAVTFTASTNAGGSQFRWNFGDGTTTIYSTSPSATHIYSAPGIYSVTVTATDSRGVETSMTFTQIVHLPLTAHAAVSSSGLLAESVTNGSPRLWVVNPDNDSVSLLNGRTGNRIAEIPVGKSPRSLALAGNGMVWVTNRGSDFISLIDPGSLSVTATVPTPRVSQQRGIVMSPDGATAYVVYGATGKLARFDTATLAPTGTADVGRHARGVALSGDGTSAWVSRFITPPQPGESTATVSDAIGGIPTGGEVVHVRTSDLAVLGTTVLAHSHVPDSEVSGGGVPNYLGTMAISPDGTQGFVPSKQDNLYRGTLRSGSNLSFQNTVRAISSRVDLSTGFEDFSSRIDHDNAGVASAAAFDPYGVYLFVALETSREVVVVDAFRHQALFRVDVGIAPQNLALSADGRTLYVGNFLDRNVSVFDLVPLLDQGQASITALGTWSAIGAGAEHLTAQVLQGKKLFYDARDTRLAFDRYISCASCHNDGDGDGRVWDLTGFGEGLRNTISLRGKAGGQGPLHWSGNFDEVQDFEGQIRALDMGTGLMSNADFFSGTHQQPLGDPKAGLSPDLDALAAYVKSLDAGEGTPYRPTAATLTPEAEAGEAVFVAAGCAGCHGSTSFTVSAPDVLIDIGTLKPSSGERLGGPLPGIDIPTLRSVWSTAPYLHDGSAATLADAVRAHDNVTVSDADLPNLVAYLQSIGPNDAAPQLPPATGTGLQANYFNNPTLEGAPVASTVEGVDWKWTGSPYAGVKANRFSARWTGFVTPSYTGWYRFRTVSNDGMRLSLGGTPVIDDWSEHATAHSADSAPVLLESGKRYAVTIEYYDVLGAALARFQWQVPGAAKFVPVPAGHLFPS